MKIVVVAKLKAKEGKFDDLKKYLADKIPEALGFDGCHLAHACTDKKEKTITLYEIWNSKDQHIKYVSWRKEQGVHDTISEMLLERTFSYQDFLI